MKPMPRACNRCCRALRAASMSRFNTDWLCEPCLEDERLAPGYQKAREAELAAVERGDRNSPGVGLSSEDLAFLAARRAQRFQVRPA